MNDRCINSTFTSNHSVGNNNSNKKKRKGEFRFFFFLFEKENYDLLGSFLRTHVDRARLSATNQCMTPWSVQWTRDTATPRTDKKKERKEER